MKKIVFLLLFLFVSRSFANKQGLIPTTEYYALQDLFESTNGAHWSWTNVSSVSVPWNFTIFNLSAPCSNHWQGLTCRCISGNCRIESLVLPSHNLTGALPLSIGAFPILTELSLQSNTINGTIPRTVSNLRQLQVLSLFHNYLTGPLPEQIGELTFLEKLLLFHNFLNGSLPASIYQCNNLQFVQLQFNFFSGQLSSAISNWSTLVNLKIASNDFTGSIPVTIGHLTNLTFLEVNSNYLNGSLPHSLYTLTRLKFLDFIYNYITGTISPAIANLTNLSGLYAYGNRLHGTLPINWFNRSIPMRSLDLGGNLLSREIPAELSNWKRSLHSIALHQNSFTGTLSKDLNTIERVYDFRFEENFLQGNVSELFLNQTYLVYLFYANNSFTGPLPVSTHWNFLALYVVSNNYFSGTFPSLFNQSSLLNYMDVGANLLSGPLPHYFNQPKLYTLFQYAIFSQNFFTGNINNTFESLHKLISFSVCENALTGTIPEAFGHLPLLEYFVICANKFTGSIPASFTKLPHLQVLFVQQNLLTGTITHLLQNPSIQTVDVSDNRLTGSLPFATATTDRINSFSASTNCFHGVVPVEICNLTSVQVISLDGLSTALDCRKPIFPGSSVFSAFILENSLTGEIPQCLFSMPNLITLHLSGNGLSGSFTSNLEISAALTDLTLSYNRLTGTIPRSIQERSWNNLDLSYNKLRGTLSRGFAPYSTANQSLSLEGNRLSGEVPNSLLSAENINLINGNLFSCDYDRDKLPDHDPSSESYSCGSDTVDLVFYLWVFLLVVAFLFMRSLYFLSNLGRNRIVTFIQESRSYLGMVSKWYQYFQIATEIVDSDEAPLRKEEISKLQELSIYFRKVRLLFLLLALFMVLLLMPIYGVLTNYYSSFTYSYIWVLSAVFLTGSQAGLGLLLLFLISLLLLMIIFKTIISSLKSNDLPNRHSSRNLNVLSKVISRALSTAVGDNNYEEKTTSRRLFSTNSSSSLAFRKSESKDSSQFKDILILIMIGVLNCLIMLTADGLYVGIILNYNAVVVAMAEVVLAVFKVLLNNTLLWRAIPYFHELLNRSERNSDSSPERQNHSQCSKETTVDYQTSYKYTGLDLTFLSFTLLLNNLVFPAIAIFIVSTDCFYYALFAADGVASTYQYEVCGRYLVTLNGCAVPITNSEATTYYPPFIYSFHCASRVVVSYVAVLMLMFIFEGMVQPFYKLTVKFFYDRYWEHRPALTIASPPNLMIEELGTPLERIITISNPIVSSQPPPLTGPLSKEEVSSSSSSSARKPAEMNLTSVPLIYRLLFASLPANLQQLTPEPSLQITASLLLFDKNRVVVKLNSYLVVFMSFGVVFPPLALIIFLAVMSLTLYEETVIGRVLYDAEKLQYHWYRKQIDRNCSGISNASKHAWWMIVPPSCLLFAYLIFDTWGDEEGWLSALAPTFVMLCVPTLILFTYSKRQVIWKVCSSYSCHSEPARIGGDLENKSIENPTLPNRVISANRSGIMLTDVNQRSLNSGLSSEEY